MVSSTKIKVPSYGCCWGNNRDIINVSGRKLNLLDVPKCWFSAILSMKKEILWPLELKRAPMITWSVIYFLWIQKSEVIRSRSFDMVHLPCETKLILQPCQEHPGIWKCSHRPKWAFSSKTFPLTLHGRIFHRLWSECYLNSSLPSLPGKVQKGSLGKKKKIRSSIPSELSCHIVKIFMVFIMAGQKGKEK